MFTLEPEIPPPSHTWQVPDVTGTIHTSFAEFMYFLEREDPLLRVMHASECASACQNGLSALTQFMSAS